MNRNLYARGAAFTPLRAPRATSNPPPDPRASPSRRPRHGLQSNVTYPTLAGTNVKRDFGHIFSGDGYSAGYYVYIWADAMSADVSEAFVEAGSFYDKATCRRLRDTIFSVGNSVAPDVAFKNFHGRVVDTNALMRDRGFPVT